MPEPLLRFSEVSRRFGRVQALQGVSFTIEAGEFVGLVGHNGAGKSTAIRLLTGQLRPSSGRVEVAGLDVARHPREVRALFGYVPEEPALYDYLTGREFLDYVAAVRGGADTAWALELAGLGEDADRLLREYSQGMRRRVALAAALLGRPPLLVLDEALNGLDPPSSARLRAALAELCARGHAVLLSTHVLETLERVASRVLVLSRGRLVADELVDRLGPGGLERLFRERVAEPPARGGSPR